MLFETKLNLDRLEILDEVSSNIVNLVQIGALIITPFHIRDQLHPDLLKSIEDFFDPKEFGLDEKFAFQCPSTKSNSIFLRIHQKDEIYGIEITFLSSETVYLNSFDTPNVHST